MIALILVILSQIADFVTTTYGFQHGFTEGNVLTQGAVGTPEFAVIKYLTCLLAVLMWLMFRRTKWLWFIRGGFLVSATITFGYAIHNILLITQ